MDERTMPAYRVTGWGGPAQLREVPVPRPGPGQVLVRVAGCGLCRSDLGMMRMPASRGQALGWSMPFTLGHETAGRVAAIGSAAAADLAEGDAVALVAAASCGRCRYCVAGQDNACPASATGRGYGRDGGLAPYVLVGDPRDLVPLGDLAPESAGPLTDAGSTAYHGVRRVRPRLLPEATAVVLGAGGLGGFAVQFLRVLGAARVIAVDVSADRRDRAVELGAHEALDGVDESTVEALRERTGGAGADAVLDFVGTDVTIGCGLGALAPGGAFGLVGSAGGGLRGNWFSGLPRDGEVFTFQGSDISDTRAVVALARSGMISNRVETFALEDVGEAYRRLAEGSVPGRAVVNP
ncbi:alcohol dehydrogenase catalytic domain-containing protein [Amycolatopsis taiwanensis]|uniref:alcohol dehydrogenase n=1 Tax=Amycolatopsis taiwanensis TaxID=342230 RepID=A0A9W6VBW9_9PSEU|nr:alcohol dehydrogenase catalytic domain-containing protein [Amycolatopsis taiwanensis]GLY65468.1 oxidoreductase [Amycolatopsis taiwanensis]